LDSKQSKSTARVADILLAKAGDSTVAFSSWWMSSAVIDLANARSEHTIASMQFDISAGVSVPIAFGDSAQWISDALTAGDRAHSAAGDALLNRQTTVDGPIASVIVGHSTTAVIRSQIVQSGATLIRHGSAQRVSSRHTTFGAEMAFNSDGLRASSFKMQHSVGAGRQDSEYGAVDREFISVTMACTRSGGACPVADNMASWDDVMPP